jgi:hypothetical protein
VPQHRLRVPDPSVLNPEERPTVWSDEDPRAALQDGDAVTADGVGYVVTGVEMQRDREGRLRPASYVVERA